MKITSNNQSTEKVQSSVSIANLNTNLRPSEIKPEIFADAVHHGMLISINGIEKVLKT